MRRPKLFSIFAVALLGVCPLLPLHSQQNRASLLIINAQVADGTGAPLRKANVRIALSHIVGVGELQPEKGEATIDAHGLVLAPGSLTFTITPPKDSRKIHSPKRKSLRASRL